MAIVMHSNNAPLELNDKFVPGLVASALMYWCDDHKAYHVRDDEHVGDVLAWKLIQSAATCNTMPAWTPDAPLDPKKF